jgi:hypothetical protein
LKKFIYILVCLAWLGNLVAQESYEKPFYNKRRPGIMRFYTLNAPTETSAEKFDRFYSDFHYNSWLGDKNGVETKYYSIGHGLSLMFDIPFSKTSRFGLGIGLGYTHFNIRHDGIFNFSDSLSLNQEKYTNLSVYQGTDRWINRTAFNFIEIPVEFRIRSRKERPKFKFYPGFKVGYLAGMYHKWRVNDKKYKEFNFPDQQKLHYGPTVRIGVSNIMLFGYYDLTMLFENPQSNKLQLFSAGISISWF